MYDQADQLRQLVSDAAAAATDGERGRPLRLVVAGGKGGVGSTTVAVNLAVEIARAGHRTVLVDADPNGGDVATTCGLEDRHTIVDVIAGRRTAEEALVAGPGGIRILPGAWAVDSLAEMPDAAHARLIGRLDGLAGDADVIVVDAGNGRDALARRLWHAADKIVVVSTAELAAVMDAYGSIKVLRPDRERTRVCSLVNMASGTPSSKAVQRRLVEACSRFLGFRLTTLGYLLQDPQVAESTKRQQPLAVVAPDCPCARLIRQMAATLLAPELTPPSRRLVKTTGKAMPAVTACEIVGRARPTSWH